MLGTLLETWTFAGALIFARVGAFIMLLPGFADPGPSARVRLAFALLVTAVMAPGLAAQMPPPPPSMLAMGLLVAGEVIIGLAMGLLIRILMATLTTAGQIIATQTGLAMAMAFDPTQRQQTALFGVFLNLVGVALIFASDLHHSFLLGLQSSYGAFTPGGAMDAGDAAELAVSALGQSFALAVQMSAPLIVFGLVFYLGLGILSRLMPQLQVFFVAMPLNVLFGLAMLSGAVGVAMLTWLDAMTVFAESFG